MLMTTNREELITPVQFAQVATDLIDKVESPLNLRHREVSSVLSALRELGYSILTPEKTVPFTRADYAGFSR
jgi:hypothetical protein